MFSAPRFISLAVLCFSLLFAVGSSAQERSKIGDGTLYYCMGVGGTPPGLIYKIKGNKKVSYNKAVSDMNSRIRKVRNDIKKAIRRKKDTSQLQESLNKLNDALSDIKSCKTNGSTGDVEHSLPTNPCEVAGGTPSVAARIIAGQSCEIGTSPVVYIFIQGPEEEDQYECTGIVVAAPGETTSRTVITAAHCAEDAVFMSINIPGGTLDASEFYMDPDWSSDQDILEDGDVAVLLFDQDIPTKAAHIAASDFAAPGMSGVIAGYGLDENDESDEYLLRAGKVTLAEVDSSSLIVNYNGSGSNTCSGDSGGPLFLNSGTEWVLAGTTSNGTEDSCGPGDRSAFANLRNPGVKAFVNDLVPGLIP